jgi:hypothetical protein
MLFSEYLRALVNQPEKRVVLFKKSTRKTLETGRREKLAFNPKLEIPVVGTNPQAKVNRERRYKRRSERLGNF